MKRTLFGLAMAGLLATAAPLAAQADYRGGLWGGLGFGFASLSCFDCEGDSESGWNGFGRIGGTVSPEVRLAAGTNSWNKRQHGTDFQVATLQGEVHWFPNAGDWFVYGGAGIGSTLTDQDVEDTSFALTAGVGYSINLGQRKKIALVPEAAISFVTTDGTPYFIGIGMGFFWN